MKLRAMVLDDDPLIVSLLSEVLRCRGYEVTGYSAPHLCPCHGEESCPCPLGEPCADVMLCDVNMPLVNGLDFVAARKRMGCQCRHVALISGRWSETDLRRALKLGLKCFAKPFDLRRINAWLDEAEQAHGAA